MLKQTGQTFRTAAWLGWQIESNWTDPLLFFAFSILKPIASVLILVFMYNVVAQTGPGDPVFAYIYLGNAFYSLWLDPSMSYSSALYRDETADLGEAQQAKYGRILDRLGDARSRVLEIGCGWGGFIEAALERNKSVTGLTISDSGPPDAEWYGSPPVLIGDVRGADAEAVIAKLPAAADGYAYTSYSVWPGPNSNSFVAAIA